ncbi:histidine decarboxylase [Porticoccaceae bacterium LTM1]|nr:histidine decarboxylase [Porticoccaceae bacterium LTM1]
MSLSEANQQRLQDFIAQAGEYTKNYLGYPISRDFSLEELYPLLSYPLNNIGDPFLESTLKFGSREFEREVIEFFAKLLRAPEDNWWGYVTNGGSEGNLYGLYLARELYPNGICYFSQDTHYSVSKNLHLLNTRHIMIKSQANGEMNYEDLRETMRVHRDVPPILFVNSGTTMTEARDNLDKIHQILDDLAITQYYIHVDAALAGAINPFLDPRPKFDFADGADSVSISGHKFIGSPIPCGVVIARKDKVQRIARSISYIGTMDTTITGSRNGFTPMVLWHAINKYGMEGLRERAMNSLEMAAYTEKRLKEIGVDAWRNPNAITVVLPQVSENLQNRWQLATSNGICHLILMPNTPKEQIDQFIGELAAELEQAKSVKEES